MRSVAVGDLNGDGYSDLVAANENNGTVSVLLNTTHAGRLELAATSADKSEGNSGNTPFSFTVTRTGGTTVASTVNWGVTGSGSHAAAASDFVGSTYPSGTLSFAAGESSKTITVHVAGETVAESAESFTVSLSNALGATIGTGSATGTIRNDDAAPLAGPLTRISVDSSGNQADGFSLSPTISADGRFVAFISYATNLVAAEDDAPASGSSNVFLRDTKTGQTAFLSTSISSYTPSSTGNTLNSNPIPAISADGQFVAFAQSDALSGVGIALRDIKAEKTTAIAVDPSGAPGNNFSYYPAINADGRFVAFVSDASNLVAEDTNGRTDVFLRDTRTGQTTRISVASNGAQAEGGSIHLGSAMSLSANSATTYQINYAPAVSADGRYVAFNSRATNLVDNDTNNSADIFLRDTKTGQTTRISVDSTGTEGDNDSFDCAISADGRFVVFSSLAANLVDNDTNGSSDIFLRDTKTGKTTRISVGSSGNQGNNISVKPQISADGRFVVFSSLASNLVDKDTNRSTDVFLRDIQTGQTMRLSVNAANIQGNSSSAGISADGPSAISADGRYVAFSSNASNLVGDTNGVADIFLRDTQAMQLPSLSIAATSAEEKEGKSGSTPFTFTVTRSGVTKSATTVGWSVTGSGDAAAAANDFAGGTLPTGTLTFAAGETSKSITVHVTGDTAIESDEGFTLSLANVSGATIDIGTAIGTIRNDDVDTTAPLFVSAAVNGNTLVMTYTEATTLDALNTPATGVFTVVSGGSANAVTAVAVDASNKTVTLTLSDAVAYGQTATVAYADPTGGNDAKAIQDAAGNDAVSLAATAVVNNTPYTPPPILTNLDLDPADDSGFSNRDRITQYTTGLTISGSGGRASATVSLFDDVNGNGAKDASEGVLATVSVAGSGGGWSTDVKLSPGTHSIRATQTDSAGKTSAVSDALPVTVDTTAPSVAFKAPVDQSTLNQLSIIHGTTSDANIHQVDLKILDQTKNTYQYLNKFGFLTPGEVASSVDAVTNKSQGTWSADIGGGWLPAHTYALTAVAQDLAGNRATGTVTFGFTTDGTRLATQINLDRSLVSINANETVTLTGQLKRSDSVEGGMSGQTIRLQIADPSGGTTRSFSTTTADDSGHFTFSDISGFATSGNYNVHVTSDSTSLLRAASNYADVHVGAPVGYAILVQGELDTGTATPEGLLAHKRTTNEIYTTLLNRGFTSDNIQYFNFDTSKTTAPTPDPSGGPLPNYRNLPGVAPNPVTRATLQAAIETWAKGKMLASPAPLYVIMADHGGPEVLHIGPNDDAGRITSADLGGWLNNLNISLGAQGTTGQQALAQKQVVVLGACNSGSFMDNLTTTANNRIVITSSTGKEKSYRGTTEQDGVQNGEMFLQYLFKSLGEGRNFYDAFNSATLLTETNLVVAKDTANASSNTASDRLNQRIADTSGQHPLLNDNGDAWGSNELSLGRGMDGAVAHTLKLGMELSSQQNASDPVQIGKVAPALYDAGSGTTLLWAKETNPSATPNARSAWVSVMGPQYVPVDSSTSTDPQLSFSLPTGAMTYNATLQRWEISASSIPGFSNFADPGRYEFQYAMQDAASGALAAPVVGYVYKNKSGNLPPGQVALETPASTSVVNSIGLFNWSDASDPEKNKVSYTLTIAKDQAFANEVYRVENLALSRNLIDFTETGIDAGDYWWRVDAVDNFGARSTSLPQKFTLSLTNALPEILQGIVASSLDFSRLASVALSFNGKPVANTEKDGSLALLLSTTEGTLKLEAPGYQTKSIAITSANAQQSIAQINLDPLTVVPFTTQVSGLNSTQIAALTVTQAAGLSTTQIGSLTATQLKGLSAVLMGNLSGEQVRAMTMTQVKALSKTQMSALSSTQMGSLSPAFLAALSLDQIKGMTATQIAGLTTSQGGGLTVTFIKTLSGTQVAGLTTAQLSALTTTQTGSLSGAQIRSMRMEQIAGLSTLQMANLASAQASGFTTTQMGGLSAEQVGALTGTLLQSLTATQMGGMTATQMAGLSPTQVGKLTVVQVAALTPAQMAGFDADDMAALSATQVSRLSATQMAAMSVTQMSGLTATAIAAMTTTQFMGVPTAWMGSLSPTQMRGLTATHIKALTTTQMAGLSVTQVAALTTAQIARLSTAHMGVLGSESIAALTITQMPGLTSSHIAALTTGQLGGLESTDLAILSSTQMAAFSATGIGMLTTDQMGGLTSAQVRDLSITQARALSSEQIAALTTTQVKGLEARDIAMLTAAVTGLTTAQIAVLSVTQVGGLTSTQLGTLSADQVGGLTITHVKALTILQIPGLTAEDIDAWGMTDDMNKINALSAAQIKALTPGAVVGLSSHINHLSTTQVKGFDTGDFALLGVSVNPFSADQIAALSSDQKKAYTAALTVVG
ncbi:MAG: Ig-like domain-containing protein [Magnetococcus sp. MYC-9]